MLILTTSEVEFGWVSIDRDETDLLHVDEEETEVKNSDGPLADASIGHWTSASFRRHLIWLS